MSVPKLGIALRPTPYSKAVLGAIATQKKVDPDLREIDPIHRAFRPMVMEAAFDVSELAIVTALQAVDYGKPIIALPITVAARFQHKCIVQNIRFGALKPEDLRGRGVAVRAYSQTTGFWVRNILEMEYGVTSDTITWITQEAPHVAEAEEPPNVLRDPNGAGPLELLEAGEVAAAIFGNDLPDDPWVEPVIDNADERARKSFARSGVVPINHVVAVARDFAERRPDLVRHVYESFATCRPGVYAGETLTLHPLGFDEMRHSIDVLLSLAAAQRLTRRRLTFQDLFGEAARLLGDRG